MSSEIDVAFTALSDTDTVHEATILLTVFAVTTAVPSLIAVIVPFDTFAIVLLLVSHVIVLSSVSAGIIVAVIFSEFPLTIVKDFLLRFIPCAYTTGLVTVTRQSDWIPLSAFAVMLPLRYTGAVGEKALPTSITADIPSAAIFLIICFLCLLIKNPPLILHFRAIPILL